MDPNVDVAKRYPAGFVWGAATSSYQIEGAATVDGRGPSVWDTFCRRPGAVVGGDDGSVAIDHYHRMRDDVALMADLGLQAYRFSIAWPRVLPDGTGAVNERGLDFYRSLVDTLLEHGIEPYPTLFHWDLPQALHDRGGFVSRDAVGWFTDYAEIMVRALGDRVTSWATLNEPWCYAYLGHASGIHAPGEHDPRKAVAVAHHQLLAHGVATQAMRALVPSGRFGVVINPAPFHIVDTTGAVTLDTRRRTDGILNRWFFDSLLTGRYPADVLADYGPLVDGLIHAGDEATIGTKIDWLGLNYYHDHLMGAPGPDNGQADSYPNTPRWKLAPITDEVTDMDWPITPSGLTDLMVRLKDEYPSLPPLAVTENGAAYDDPLVDGVIADDRRVRYIDAHLRAGADAIAAGVDLQAWFVWSLFDNFEWAEGYAKRFGIVHVDYDTLVRTPKASALYYRDVIRAHTAG